MLTAVARRRVPGPAVFKLEMKGAGCQKMGKGYILIGHPLGADRLDL